jgi:hypothetical protein
MTSTALRLGVRPTVAAAAALATAAIGTVWASAVVAEVNALHLAFIALIVERSLAYADGKKTRDLAIGGLLIGLSLGNHLLTAFVAPFFVLFALWGGREALWERKRRILAPLLAGLAGLAVYAYIPIAASLNPPLPYNHPTSFESFRFLVTGEQFRSQYDGLFTIASFGKLADGLPALWSVGLGEATAIVPVLGLIGIAILLFRRPAFGLACAGALLVGFDIWANYLHLEHYLLVPWLLLGIGLAVTLEGAARLVERYGPRVTAGLAGPGTALAGVALAVALVALNLPSSDRSQDTSGQTYVDAVFALLPRNAVILTFWGPSSPLWHAQQVEGERPDVLVVDDTNIVYEGWGTRENRIAAVICSRPVYDLRVNDNDMIPTRARWDVTTVATVRIGSLGPTARYTEPIYLVTPRPGTCP